jgi:hypothetical protein
MPRAFAWILIAIATLRLAGGDLLVLQVTAWGSMLATRTAEQGLSEAVKTTFDGDHPCRLCTMVQEAATGEEKAPAKPTPVKAGGELSKLNEFPATTPLIVPDARLSGLVQWASEQVLTKQRLHDGPLVPPPRYAA